MAEEYPKGVVQRVRKLVTEAIDLLDSHSQCREAAAHLALVLDELTKEERRIRD
jgi:hypothetical protein